MEKRSTLLWEAEQTILKAHRGLESCLSFVQQLISVFYSKIFHNTICRHQKRPFLHPKPKTDYFSLYTTYQVINLV